MSEAAAIPVPSETPERPIVVYDGECRFCRRQVDRLKKRDQADVFDYVPRQEDWLEQRFPKLAEGDFNTGMRLIRTDGTIAVAADAVYEIARRVSIYRWFAWLYTIPGLRWIFRRIYAWIAANRQRLGRTCDDGACEI